MNSTSSRLFEMLKRNAMLIILIIVTLLFDYMIRSKTGGNGSIFRPTNITNLINQNGYVVVLTCGMLLCILTGGNIDLAIGSTVALVGAFAGVMMVEWHMNIYLASFLCLAVGLLLGAWQAFWIAYIKIPPFIVTLSGMLAFRGITQTILGGTTISAFPPEFSRYFNSFIPWGGSGMAGESYVFTLTVAAIICAVFVIQQIWSRVAKLRKGYTVVPLWEMLLKVVLICAVVMLASWRLALHNGFPVVLVILGAVALACSYFTSNTVPGRQLYAMGGNEKAARLSGVNTDRLMFFVYTCMGFLSGLAALICVARFDTANPNTGQGYELDAIGACFIGGASAYGGVGTIFGTIIGAIFMGVLNNGMSLLSMGADWQRTVKGLVLLAAVIFDVMSQKRKRAT